MATKILVAPHHLPSSARFTAESVVDQQWQQNTANIWNNQTRANDTELSSVGNPSEIGSMLEGQMKGGWSSIAPFCRGLLLGVLACGVVLVVVLTLWLTSATNQSSTITSSSASSPTTTVTTTSTSTSTTTSTTSSTSTTTTTSISTSTTSTTTTTTNTCISNNLRWNSTGVTVLNSSQLVGPTDLFFDANDTLYIVDEFVSSVVWKLPKNTVSATVVAGQLGTKGSSVTQLDYPQGAYVDKNRNLYVTDYYNARVQKYIGGSMTGVTVAGITQSNGTALNQFGGLRYLCFDPAEAYMYVTDCDNHRIMRYSTSSTTGTNGVVVAGGNGNGIANNQLTYPWGIHYLPSVSSYLYITNANGHSVMQWAPGAPSGTFIAGTPGLAGSTSSLLRTPMGIKTDAYLNMYVVDNGNHRVQMFCQNSQVGITIAGTGTAGNGATQLSGPRGIAFDSAMNMYIGDQGNSRVQKFSKL